jgi:hypothetical protein
MKIKGGKKVTNDPDGLVESIRNILNKTTKSEDKKENQTSQENPSKTTTATSNANAENENSTPETDSTKAEASKL